jgi:hypothetical protein
MREEARVFRVADLADVDVAARVDREPVRRDELPVLEARPRPAAEARDEPALAVDDGEARSDVGLIAVHRHPRPELADDELRFRPAAAVQAARPVHVDPLRLVAAVAVEHLDAVVLAVGHVDPPLRVGGDVVRDVELPRVGARLAPGEKQLSVG